MATKADPQGFTAALGEFFTATGQPRLAASCYAAALAGRRKPGRLRYALAEALMRSGCTSPSTLAAVRAAVPDPACTWEYWALWVGSALTLTGRGGSLPLGDSAIQVIRKGLERFATLREEGERAEVFAAAAVLVDLADWLDEDAPHPSARGLALAIYRSVDAAHLTGQLSDDEYRAHVESEIAARAHQRFAPTDPSHLNESSQVGWLALTEQKRSA